MEYTGAIRSAINVQLMKTRTYFPRARTMYLSTLELGGRHETSTRATG